MQWLMLQQDQPEDFVIASGQQYSVRQFIEWTARELGFTIAFSGRGEQETGVVSEVSDQERTPGLSVGQVVVHVDPRYFRPTEVETLLGDPTKAKEKLGWVPEITAQAMCAEMVAHDLEEARKRALLKRHGFHVDVPRE